MEIYATQHLSLLPAGACASLPAGWRPRPESVVVPAAQVEPLPGAHQVRVQAELAQVRVLTGENYGTNGFRGSKATGTPTANIRAPSATNTATMPASR